MKVLPRETCRRLLLESQLPLLRAEGAAALGSLIRRLGFVQLDSINVLERAHHLTLWSRMPGYAPEMLGQLLERRELFEHWTHDASYIPIDFYPYWRYRGTLYPTLIERHSWWRERLGGDPEAMIASVRRQVEECGPVTSRDFEGKGKAGPWWGWKREKAALEYLWRTGDLAVSSRQGFVKLYDLSERVFPSEYHRPMATPKEYQDWAFDGALQRLGVATPKELAEFWGALSLSDAREWCAQACRQRRAIAVELEGAGPGVACLDWEERLQRLRLPAAPRILNPFDPVVRDRKRLLRLFGFDYRFEAFVPASQRVYGYFVLPILERERFVGRCDAKRHRDQGVLELKGFWWEGGVRPTATRREAIKKALARLAAWLGTELAGPGLRELCPGPEH